MKFINSKYLLVSLFTIGIFSNSILAQEIKTEVKSNINKWSFEINFGTNRAVRPFGTGYNSNEKDFLGSPSLNHFDFGFRYMLNSKFGVKTDFGFDAITNKDGNGSLPFKSMQSRFGIQGVFDLGKVFEFDTFTKTIGLLAHGGVQFSQFKAKNGLDYQEAAVQTNGGYMLGITPQIKLTDRSVLTLDFTVISNVRQRLNWDGTVSAQENNLAGLLYTSALGVTFYLGKNANHSDWVTEVKYPSIDPEILKRLSLLESLLVDTDKDGIADVNDLQNNTPSGVMVDSKGRFIDTNTNGVPDEYETQLIENAKVALLQEELNKSEKRSSKNVFNNNLVNVFYDVDKDEPNSASTNSIYGMISYLKSNPTINVKLTGYSDKSGSEKFNQNLSERRVKKLYDLMIVSGISASRIKIIGQGVDNSVPSNPKTALQLARRVSIFME
ncbi:OmpA family protein [Flavobacterium sp.]|uniref:OmpA family protein n=1 Tax=Flavobacterium sp. TaxID=239 RepID=UPI0038CF3538